MLDSETTWTLVRFLFVKPFLGLIPACIADNKGCKFGKWWLYGYFFPILSFFHAIIMGDKTAQPSPQPVVISIPRPDESYVVKSDAEKIREYKKMQEEGIITEAEFEEKKRKILNQ